MPINPNMGEAVVHLAIWLIHEANSRHIIRPPSPLHFLSFDSLMPADQSDLKFNGCGIQKPPDAINIIPERDVIISAQIKAGDLVVVSFRNLSTPASPTGPAFWLIFI